LGSLNTTFRVMPRDGQYRGAERLAAVVRGRGGLPVRGDRHHAPVAWRTENLHGDVRHTCGAVGEPAAGADHLERRVAPQRRVLHGAAAVR
jgi:hypothetical protein